MFALAFLIGIYSYGIFFLGLLGLLSKNFIAIFTLVFLLAVLFWKRKILLERINTFSFNNYNLRKYYNRNKVLSIFILLFLLQALINLIGALGPELAFDALWYHLTLPKLYLTHHMIYHIPGGLLYYSDMPKLAEMLFTSALAFGNEIVAKLLQFSFGLLSCIALYKLSRKFFDPLISLIAVVIFYSNLVVAWESITAYNDLIRTFFELMALWGFINWWETQKRKWLIISAAMVGLAVTTKLLAIGSLIIFVILIVSSRLKWRDLFNRVTWTEKIPLPAGRQGRLHFVPLGMTTIKDMLLYLFIALAIPFPWFIFSYIHTGNPVFPFFTSTYGISPSPLNPFKFVLDIWNLFTHASDPLTPLYIIFFPLLVWTFPKFSKQLKIITIYSLLGIIVWYFTPQTGGGRFILPYLPALSLVCAGSLLMLMKEKKIDNFLPRFLLGTIIFVSVISIFYRFAANAKYLPVLLGRESKHTFLTTHLNFSYGDFYDTDNYFSSHIKPTDTVLLYGFHNLYYVEFPFIDASWLSKGEKFNYVATQNTKLPNKYKNWKLIYTNKRTMVKLYKIP